MKIHSMKELFLFTASEIYAIENHIVADLAKLSKVVSSEELKKAIVKHHDETKEQIKRLDKVFRIANAAPHKVDTLTAFKSFSSEAERFIKENPSSALVDAAIIIMLQRIEHFEIATYGTLVEFAKVLELNEAEKLLHETLKEEFSADETLTKIAKGGLFTVGVNSAATRA